MYKVALFIGRFQPFHNGHLYVLKKALGLAEKVIIGIGSSNIQNEKNPWNFETRKKMIQSIIKHQDLQNKIQAVWAIPDVFDNDKWGNMIVESLYSEGVLGSEIVVVGNNDWTNNIMRMKGLLVVEPGLFKRNELEGLLIRQLMGKHDMTWKNKVPISVVKCLLG